MYQILQIQFNNKHPPKLVDIDKLKDRLRSRYRDFWRQSLDKPSNTGKLSTYTTFKKHFQFENHLNIHNLNYRKALTDMRISTHKLNIETGRHTKPKTPREKRLCTLCDNKHIEDEMHVMLNCRKYKSERDSLYESVRKSCKNFDELSEDQKFFYLMTAENDIALAVGKYCHLVFEIRKNTQNNISAASNPEDI